MLPDHELIADVGKGSKRYKTAATFLEWSIVPWCGLSFLLFLLLSGVRLENRAFYVDGDPVLFARAIVCFVLTWLVIFACIAFTLGWPRPWGVIPGIVVASAPLACFSTNSLMWGLILTATLAVIFTISYLLLIPLYKRPGLYSFIRQVVRLRAEHRQGIHQVLAIQGYGPWMLRLQPVPSPKDAPRFSAVRFPSPPRIAPGDFVAVNRDGHVEIAETISR